MNAPDPRRQQLLAFKADLERELTIIDSELDTFRANRENTADDDEHDPDGIPMSSVWQRLDSQRLRILGEINSAMNALGDVDLGVYGVCEICGDQISQERLEFRPATRRCVRCVDLRL